MSADTSISSATDEALEAVDLENRRCRLVFIAIGGAIVSILATLLFRAMFWRGDVGWWDGVFISVVVGTFVGLAQAPVLGWTIARKRLVLALPLIYVGAVAISCLVLQRHETAWALVAVTFTVPLLASIAMLLPNQQLGRRDRCYGCGYDLSRNQSDACPECGAPVLTFIKSRGDSEGAP